MNLNERINAGEFRNRKPYPHDHTGLGSGGVARAAYRAEESSIMEKFVSALFAEYGVTGNPKANRAFSIAWEHGHSGGYSEVASYFADLVDLIK